VLRVDPSPLKDEAMLPAGFEAQAKVGQSMPGTATADGTSGSPCPEGRQMGEDDVMPRIRAANLEDHHERVWADLTEAVRQLLEERDYDSINMGHIATRAGLARNTLYNYARDKASLVAALVQRASSPTVDHITRVAAQRSDPATLRMREILAVLLEATTDRTMQLMLRPAADRQLVPEAPGVPFSSITAAVESVVRDGIANGEFREVDDVALTVALLAGIVRSGAELLRRDPSALATVTAAAEEIVVTFLTCRRLMTGA
jgi:AcrR family transcriptional regulator